HEAAKLVVPDAVGAEQEPVRARWAVGVREARVDLVRPVQRAPDEADDDQADEEQQAEDGEAALEEHLDALAAQAAAAPPAAARCVRRRAALGSWTWRGDGRGHSAPPLRRTRGSATA